MKIRKNTVIVTVGPSNCGKSYWCNNHLVPVLSGEFESVHYISTDDLRRYVLNKDLDKYDRQMWAASNQAFDLLFAELEAVISYPCNQDVVVIDSTALNADFRKRVVNLAKKHNYGVQYVLFDYDVKEYFGDGNSDVIKKHYNSFKRDVLPVISREIETKNITRIKSKSKFDFQIEIERDNARTLKLDSENVCIIGDVHSSKSFFEMVERTKNFDKIVLIGDVIDKGREEDCEEIIEYILANPRFLVIKGNHEHFFSIYDKTKNSVEQDVLDCYFGHTQSTNEGFKAKIHALIAECYDFIEGPNWIATHSPCELK
jgi:predicted kinase